MDKQANINACTKDFERILGNPVFFIEAYWNNLHPDQKLDLNDDEKEQFFRQHRILVPHFSNGESFHSFVEEYEKLKSQGLKDWQIF